MNQIRPISVDDLIKKLNAELGSFSALVDVALAYIKNSSDCALCYIVNALLKSSVII
jgi:hypothetical protein